MHRGPQCWSGHLPTVPGGPGDRDSGHPGEERGRESSLHQGCGCTACSVRPVEEPGSTPSREMLQWAEESGDTGPEGRRNYLNQPKDATPTQGRPGKILSREGTSGDLV